MYKEHSVNNFKNFVPKLNQIKNQINPIFTNSQNSQATSGMEVNTGDSSNIFQSDFLNNNMNNIQNNNIQQKDKILANQNQKKIIQDPSSNYNTYKKDNIPQHTHKKIVDNPKLKTYNPKAVKKENIDKKVIRKFRNYLIEHAKSLDFSDNESKFWISFIKENLLPPMKYYNPLMNEKVDFKSFNSKYLTWFFSKKGAKSYYANFINDRLNEVMHDLIGSYEAIGKSSDLYYQILTYVQHLANTFGDEEHQENMNNYNNYPESIENNNDYAPNNIIPPVANNNTDIFQNHQQINYQDIGIQNDIFSDSVRADLENERQYHNYNHYNDR